MVKYRVTTEEEGSVIMLKGKIPKVSFLVLTFLSWSLSLTLFPLENSKVEAAPNANEVLTAGDRVPADNSTMKRSIDVRKPQGWEKRLLGETFSQNAFQKNQFQSQHSSLLHLKSPGRLPGIELGVEMHNIQAFQSIIPTENLPKGLDHKQDKPLLLPPSISGPDYNGGFIRFTW